MSDLDDFVREQGTSLKVRRSVLEPFKEEILALKNLGYSETAILKFLADKKQIKVAQQTLNRFIRSRQNHPTSVAPKSVPAEQTSISAKIPPPSNTAAPSSAAKFDWQQPIDVNELI